MVGWVASWLTWVSTVLEFLFVSYCLLIFSFSGFLKLVSWFHVLFFLHGSEVWTGHEFVAGPGSCRVLFSLLDIY